MKNSKSYEQLIVDTKNIALLWENSFGIAPNSTSDKIDNAMFKWQIQLTEALKIWLDKGLSLTEGELILARMNIGAIVEFWLKFFYCVYYDDYSENPIKNGTKSIEPEEAEFSKLEKFSNGILWDSKNSSEYKWVASVRNKRNAVHCFNYRDIGTAEDFILDVNHLCEFVGNLKSKLPPLEDCFENYPEGYIPDSIFRK